MMKQIKLEIYKCQLCGTVESIQNNNVQRNVMHGITIHECYKDKTKEGFDNKIGVMKLIGFEMED